MKPIKILFAVLIVAGLLLPSCRDNTNNYAVFPQGTILSGKTKDGKTFYLIREDAQTMAGICFVDNNRAVAEIIDFSTDSTGLTIFSYKNEDFSGKMSRKSKEIVLTLPEIPSLSIASQTIKLKYFNQISGKYDCIETYKHSVFENIVAEKDLQYGSALGYYTSKPTDYISKDDYKKWFSEMLSLSWKNKGFLFKYNMEELPLLLDVYRPEKSHNNKSPLLLFIHGGAFLFGDKESLVQQAITDYLVKRGFTVAAINYRLGTSITPGAIERTIYRDVQDTRAALRYLVHHREKFGIDEEQLYLAGSSAGGIISLTTAFMDSNEIYDSADGGLFNLRENLGGLDDSGNDLKEPFTIAGVASMWGAVTDLKILNNHIPTLLFHGTADDIVPCDEGLPFKELMGEYLHSILSSFGKLYGSEPIYHRLTALNVPVRYIPFHGVGHDPYIESDETLNAYMDIVCNELGAFLYENVAKHYFNYHLSGNTLVEAQESIQSYRIDNYKDVTVQWQVDGGLITEQSNDTIRVIWYSSHTTGKITACITNEKGLSCKKELEITIN
ncbi:MAG: alpha/beta hydrolase [Bacteroidales bacterium]|nr:alpha/beta hydrolase [Bacteroidales bacterium]